MKTGAFGDFWKEFRETHIDTLPKLPREVFASLSPYTTDPKGWAAELTKYSPTDQAWIIGEFIYGNFEPHQTPETANHLLLFVSENPIFQQIMGSVGNVPKLTELGVNNYNHHKLFNQ